MNPQCLWFTGQPYKALIRSTAKFLPRCMIFDEAFRTLLFDEEKDVRDILKMGHLAKMLVDQRITVLCSFEGSCHAIPTEVRRLFKKGQFTEIFVRGAAPTIVPSRPELILDTSSLSLGRCVDQVLKRTYPEVW